MELVGNEKTTGRRLFILLGLLILLFAAHMISVFSVKIPFCDVLRMVITAFGLCTLIAQLRGSLFSGKNVLLVLAVLAVLILCVSTTAYLLLPETRTTLAYGVRQVSDSVMWIGVFSWAYYLGGSGTRVVERTVKAAWAIPLFAVLFLGVKSYSGGRGIPLISTAYYALFLLPFALMLKNRTVKWLLVLCILFTVAISGKRGGFVALIIALAVYFVVAYNQTGKKDPKRLKMVLGVLAVIVLLQVLLQNYLKDHDVLILDRLFNLQEDHGSGRISIWKETWEMICKTDALSLIFGHGFNAVYRDSAIDMSAHTDVLEVIYDYGVVGTVLYALFVVRVFSCYKRVKREKPRLAAPFAVSLVLFICLSLVAHLVIYITHFMFLCVFWGTTMGELDRDVSIRRKV